MDLPHHQPTLQASLPSVTCVARASQHYKIPVPVTLALMKTEGGKPGSFVRNTNGTYDMGVMQVNTLWIPEYSKRFGITRNAFVMRAVLDGCFSVFLGLDILRAQVDREGSIEKGVAAYHSRTPDKAARYMRRFNAQLQAVARGDYPKLAGMGALAFANNSRAGGAYR